MTCKYLLSIAMIALLFSVPSFANEVSEYQGDSSWQFESPNEEIADMNKLMMQEQHRANLPVGGSAGTANTNQSNGVGGSSTSIGNYTVIEVSGNDNNINVDQSNQGSSQGSQVNSGNGQQETNASSSDASTSLNSVSPQ